MIFEFEYKRAYGNKRFYPYNKHAKVLCRMADITSLTHWQVKVLLEGDWTIKVFQYAVDRKIDFTEDEMRLLVASY